MDVCVIANDGMKDELTAQCSKSPDSIQWEEHIPAASSAGVLIDLLFDDSPERINNLQQRGSSLVIVNSQQTGLPDNFIRINGWPSFLKKSITEAVAVNAAFKNEAEAVMRLFNKQTAWCTDAPGFVTTRVVSMIINEAYFALHEDVSTKEETDIAMKLGTNYPFGPFEWSKKIGLQKVYALLVLLAKENQRYEPCPLLTKEAMQQ